MDPEDQVFAPRQAEELAPVQVIGKKIVLYKEGKKEKKKIQLPK